MGVGGDDRDPAGKWCLGVFGGIIIFGISLAIAMIVDSVHVVEEGKVGLYFVHGKRDNTLGHPGENQGGGSIQTIFRPGSQG